MSFGALLRGTSTQETVIFLSVGPWGIRYPKQMQAKCRDLGDWFWGWGGGEERVERSSGKAMTCSLSNFPINKASALGKKLLRKPST